MKKYMLVIFAVMLPSIVLGQYKVYSNQVIDFPTLLRQPVQSTKNMAQLIGIDPSRFHMSQSYSMSYLSAGGQGMTQGVYLNTISYDFQIPLTMALQFGMAHNPFPGNASYLQDGAFISGASLQYKPSKHFMIEFQYSSNPYRYSPYMYSSFHNNSWLLTE